MGAGRIEEISSGIFGLYENNTVVARFSRRQFREKLEETAHSLGSSSNWICSILRLFHKKFPPAVVSRNHSVTEILSSMSDDRFLEYLRSRGFRVYRPIKISVVDIVKHLENKGYCVEGLVHDEFYSTELERCSTR